MNLHAYLPICNEILLGVPQWNRASLACAHEKFRCLPNSREREGLNCSR